MRYLIGVFFLMMPLLGTCQFIIPAGTEVTLLQGSQLISSSGIDNSGALTVVGGDARQTILGASFNTVTIKDGGTLSVPAGAHFTIDGSLVCDANSTTTFGDGVTLAVQGFVVEDGSSVTMGTPRIVATGNIEIKTDITGFETAELTVGGGANQVVSNTRTGEITIGKLIVGNQNAEGTGPITLVGAWKTPSLELSKGILTPNESVGGKIIFTGNEGALLRSSESYVDGAFYTTAGGSQLYPIGSGGIYAPARFEATPEGVEMGVKIIPGVTLDRSLTPDIVDIEPTRAWKVELADLTQLNSKVTLGLAGLSSFEDAVIAAKNGLIIVQTDADGGVPVSLKSGTYNAHSDLSSEKNVTAPILTIGASSEVTVKIRDLITPYGSPGVNDALEIEWIGTYEHNTVMLLDRWGVTVKEWVDYENENNYDFGQLSPGNYICIAEYWNEGESKHVIKQMITILRTN